MNLVSNKQKEKDGTDATSIKGIVEGLLGGLKKNKLLKKDLIEKNWQKIVGKSATKHAKISALKAGRLIVDVDGSAWIYELTLKKQDILKKLNKSLKDIKITEIQFRICNFS